MTMTRQWLVFSACLCLCLASSAASTGDERTVEIRVRGIHTHALVAALAQYTRTDVVTGDELDNPTINIDEPSIGVMQLMGQIAANRGLALRNENGIAMMASTCRFEHAAPTNIVPGYEETVSIFYQDVTPGALVNDAFGKFMGYHLSVSAGNAEAASVHSIRDKPIWEHLRAMSIVHGWRIQSGGDGVLQIVENKDVETCTKPALANATLPITRQLEDRGQCPMSDPATKDCRPLEFYPLREMTLLGYMRLLPKTDLVAIVGTPTGLAHFVRVGGHLGPDFGVITKMTRRGLVLKEIYRAKDGVWRERTVSLPFAT